MVNAADRMFERYENLRRWDREKVASLMMRLSLATGHGDTLDDLLATLESEAERRFRLEYERGRADATAAIIEQQSAPPWYSKGTRNAAIKHAGLVHDHTYEPGDYGVCRRCGSERQ